MILQILQIFHIFNKNLKVLKILFKMYLVIILKYSNVRVFSIHTLNTFKSIQSQHCLLVLLPPAAYAHQYPIISLLNFHQVLIVF